MLSSHPRRSSAARDQGSTLVTVVVVMLVLSLLALASAAVVTSTAGSLVGSRGTTQARAAADAGLAAVVAAFRTDGDCPATNPSSTTDDPIYQTDCENSGTQVTFTSTGEAEGDAETTIEAVYLLPPPVQQREPALVTRAPLDLSALTIKSVDPSNPATVWVVPDNSVSGDFTCNSGGAIAGSVYLPAGTVFGSGGCEVKGDVYAEGNITIGSGTKIRGDLVSLNGNVTVTGGNVIDGSIYAKKKVTGSGLSGKFVESIHAGANLDLAGGAPVARDKITYGGTFTFPHSGHDAWAVNSVKKIVVDPPALPTAPQWEGFTQDDLNALVSNGMFTKVNWTGSCTHSWDHPMKAVIEGFTTPTLIDAGGCSRVDLPGQWGDLKLKTDLIFVAPSFNLVGQNFISGDGDEHRVWVISPEDPSRNCAAVQALNVQGVKMSPIGNSKISGMIFTQCTVHFANASENWQGSIHAGKMTGQPNFWYKPVGFPGQAPPDPDDGAAGGSPVLGGLLSLRDVP